MRATRLVDLAQQFIAEVLKPGDVAIDATVGNGHDTAFLARQVGPEGFVYGFDIQQVAINNTESRLRAQNLLERVELIRSSHENITTSIPIKHQSKIVAIMFNLGYLPSGDQLLTTHTKSSRCAAECAVNLIQPGGRVSILAYPGHPGGLEETETVKAYAVSLPIEFNTTIHTPDNQTKSPPELIVIKKKIKI